MNYSIVFGLSAMAIVQSVYAADLYVSKAGSGVNCVIDDPCSTIQVAVDNAAEGDTIHLANGTYTENVSLGGPAAPNAKPGITITGSGAGNTIVVSAGTNTQRPAGIDADIVFDIWSRDTTIEKLTIEHPATVPSARDIGIFVGPPATNTVIQRTEIVRKRIGDILEPSVLLGGPGSRGILVFRAKDTVIARNTFNGNYQDHIHMPTQASEITRNTVNDATRLGIVIVQETATSSNTSNIITNNKVNRSGVNGVQIQGDFNVVARNNVTKSGGAAIILCGESDGDDTPGMGDGDCIKPFDAWSDANDNSVSKNSYFKNGVDGVVDNGTNNAIDY